VNCSHADLPRRTQIQAAFSSSWPMTRRTAEVTTRHAIIGDFCKEGEPVHLSISNILYLTEHSRDLRSLVKALKTVGYSSKAVREVMGMNGVAHELLTNTAYVALAYYDDYCASTSPIAILGLMFVCGSWIETGIYERSIPALVRDLLERCGLIAEPSSGFRKSLIALQEFRSRWFFADPMIERTPDDLRVVQDFAEHIDPPNYSSVSLALNTLKPRDGDRTFLDIGCGSGVQSILASELYEHVVGVDISERAVALSRLNASVNEANVSYVRDDCMHFDADRLVDRLVFNCPSVPRYRNGLDKIDTYTSTMGHDLFFDFANHRLMGLMAPGGLAELWSIFAVTRRAGSMKRLLTERLTTHRLLDIDVVAEVDSPFGLSRDEIARGAVPRGSYLLASPDDTNSLISFLRKQDVECIVPALLRLTVKSEPQGKISCQNVERLIDGPEALKHERRPGF